MENIIYLYYKTTYLNEEVNCTESSPSVSVPCKYKNMYVCVCVCMCGCIYTYMHYKYGIQKSMYTKVWFNALKAIAFIARNERNVIRRRRDIQRDDTHPNGLISTPGTIQMTYIFYQFAVFFMLSSVMPSVASWSLCWVSFCRMSWHQLDTEQVG